MCAIVFQGCKSSHWIIMLILIWFTSTYVPKATVFLAGYFICFIENNKSCKLVLNSKKLSIRIVKTVLGLYLLISGFMIMGSPTLVIENGYEFGPIILFTGISLLPQIKDILDNSVLKFLGTLKPSLITKRKHIIWSLHISYDRPPRL